MRCIIRNCETIFRFMLETCFGTPWYFLKCAASYYERQPESLSEIFQRRINHSLHANTQLSIFHTHALMQFQLQRIQLSGWERGVFALAFETLHIWQRRIMQCRLTESGIKFLATVVVESSRLLRRKWEAGRQQLGSTFGLCGRRADRRPGIRLFISFIVVCGPSALSAGGWEKICCARPRVAFFF